MDNKPRLYLFGTPLYTRGWMSLPVNELAAWLAGRKRPERTLWQRLGVGFLSMIALLMWEWLHNIAHAAAARLAGKPMDSLVSLIDLVPYGQPATYDLLPSGGTGFYWADGILLGSTLQRQK